MTMNSSGPISLTGSTPGVSIQYELERTGAIALTDADVRALAGKPTGDVIMPTDFYGKGTPFLQANLKVFETTTSATTAIVYGNPIIGANGKIYALYNYGNVVNSGGGYYYVPGITPLQFLVFNSDGTLFAKSGLSSSISTLLMPDAENHDRVDNAGNVYYLVYSSNIPRVGGAVKFNSAGVFQSWNNYSFSEILTMSVNKSTGEIYYAGGDTIFKTDSSGNILWQRKLTNGGLQGNSTRVRVNPVNNGAFLTSYTFDPFTSFRVLSFDSAGTLLGSVLVGPTESPPISLPPTNIQTTVDSAGNLYFYASSAGQQALFVGKLNSSLVVQWSKVISVPAGVAGQTSNLIALNESKNKLFITYSNVFTTPIVQASTNIVCFDLNGTILYGRNATSSNSWGAINYTWDQGIVSYGNSYILTSSGTFAEDSIIRAGMATFPADGSKLGTYYTYTDPVDGVINTTYSVFFPTITNLSMSASPVTIPLTPVTSYVRTANTMSSIASSVNILANVNI